MTLRITQHGAAAIAVFAIAGSTLAMGPDGSEDTLLKGPDVVVSDAPGAGLAMDGTRGSAMKGGETPLRAYIGAIRALSGPDADPELALSDEQKQQVRKAAQEYGEQLKAYLREHREELAEIRELGAGDAIRRIGEQGVRGRATQRMGRVRGDDAAPDAKRQGSAPNEREFQRRRGDDAQENGAARPERTKPNIDPESRQLGMEKLRSLMQEAPSDQAAKARIWSVLSEDQQAALQTKIDELTAQREARIAERVAGGAKNKKKDPNKTGGGSD